MFKWSINRAERSLAPAVFEPGIKVIDPLAPLYQSGKVAMFGGADVGKTNVVMELVQAMVKSCQGISVFVGIDADRAKTMRF